MTSPLVLGAYLNTNTRVLALAQHLVNSSMWSRVFDINID
jgi:hypothetical protein